MYPFNLISNQQNQICFLDYGASSGRWCGSRGAVAGIPDGYFDSGAQFYNRAGISKGLSYNVDNFGLECFVKTNTGGYVYSDNRVGFFISGDSDYLIIDDVQISGLNSVGTGWNNLGIFTQNNESFNRSGSIQDFGRYGANLTGLFGFETGYFGSGAICYNAKGSGNYTELSELNSFTVQFWAKAKINSNFLAAFAYFGNSVSLIQLGTQAPPNSVTFFLSPNPLELNGSVFFPTKEWHNVAFTINKSSSLYYISGYKDGALVSSGITIGADNFKFSGKSIEFADFGAQIITDEFCLFSGALSSGDIYANFNKEIENPLLRADLLHYYKFNNSGELLSNKNYQFYKNGSQQLTGSFLFSGNSANNGRAKIGRLFSGELDEFRLWSGVRSSGEVYQYWDKPMTDYPGFAQSGLFSYVPFGTGVVTGNGIDFSSLDFSMIDFY